MTRLLAALRHLLSHWGRDDVDAAAFGCTCPRCTALRRRTQ